MGAGIRDLGSLTSADYLIVSYGASSHLLRRRRRSCVQRDCCGLRRVDPPGVWLRRRSPGQLDVRPAVRVDATRVAALFCGHEARGARACGAASQLDQLCDRVSRQQERLELPRGRRFLSRPPLWCKLPRLRRPQRLPAQLSCAQRQRAAVGGRSALRRPRAHWAFPRRRHGCPRRLRLGWPPPSGAQSIHDGSAPYRQCRLVRISWNRVTGPSVDRCRANPPPPTRHTESESLLGDPGWTGRAPSRQS